jgi:hypothetical protein
MFAGLRSAICGVLACLTTTRINSVAQCLIYLLILFSGLAIAQTSEYDIAVIGPASVFAGSDAYVQLSPVAANAPASKKFFYSASLSNAPVPYVINCHSAVCRADGLGRYYEVLQPVVLRVSIPGTTAPGQYSVILTVTSDGLTKTVNIPLRVQPPPPAVPTSPFLSSLPIPGLSKWQGEMIRLGKKCDPSFNYGTFSYEQTDWYYDGARVYFQIADYTGDRSWDACALNIARQYRDHVIANSGKLQGWRVFTRGLAMAYQRTGDPRYREAVILLSKNSRWVDYQFSVGDSQIRETAYATNAVLDAERLGEPRSPQLSRLIAYMIGHYNRLFVAKNYQLHQTFFDGLAAEALISYYELTGDPRILPTIKLMLDWLWDYGWDKSTHKMVYNPDPVGPTCASGCQTYLNDLINLVVPAYAWYWRVTGDTVYQQRGDELFAHALDTDISYSGKQFCQNYRWSLDYVQWRTVNTVDSCLYSLSSRTTLAQASGGTVPVEVTTRADCPWLARSEVPWASIAQLDKAGNGTASITVAPNPSTSARVATLHIGNQIVVVTQEAVTEAALAGGSRVGERSVEVPLTVYGSATGLGTVVPGTTSLRIEARLHNWSLATGNSRGTLGMQGFKLFWEVGQPNLICQAPYDSTSINSVKISVAGRTDFFVRCQRDVANNRLTAEIWNTDGSGYAAYLVPITKWAETLNLGTIVFGRWSWETANATFRAGFMRIFSTSTPLSVIPLEAGEPGNIANYEFENNTEDTSGNNRHLTMNTAPVFSDTPRASRPVIAVVPATYTAAIGTTVSIPVDVQDVLGIKSSLQASVIVAPGGMAPSVSIVENRIAFTASIVGTYVLRVVADAIIAQSPTVDVQISVNSAGIPTSAPNTTPVVPCTYTLNPQLATIAATGGAVEMDLITNADCEWVISGPAWVSIAPAAGRGTARLLAQAGANTTVARTDVIQLGSAAATIAQAGVPAQIACSYTMSAMSLVLPAIDGSVTLGLTAPANCFWNITTPAWATATPVSGQGTATIAIRAGANLSPAERAGTLVIAKIPVQVKQLGRLPAPASSCSLTVSSPTTAAATGAIGKLQLVTTANCEWSVSTMPAWVQVYPTKGKGSASLEYRVLPNFGSRARVHRIDVGQGSVTLTQAAHAGNRSERVVSRLYFGLLGRLPSSAEIAIQAPYASTGPMGMLVSAMMESAEYNIGSRFVGGVYLGLLARDAECSGWLFQRSALTSGIVSGTQLIGAVLSGQEYALRFGEPTGEQFVRLLYEHILFRQASSDEVAFQTRTLTTISRVTLAERFLASSEFLRGSNTRIQASLLFWSLLQRDPSPAERELLIKDLRAGTLISTIADRLMLDEEFQEIIR